MLSRTYELVLIAYSLLETKGILIEHIGKEEQSEIWEEQSVVH